MARLSRSCAAPLLLAAAMPAAAADIYVVEMHVERPGGAALDPTFLATPGENAMAEFDGGALDVSVLLLPGPEVGEEAGEEAGGATGGEAATDASAPAANADAPFELRLAIDHGDEHLADTFTVAPSESTSVKLGDYAITLTVRVQD